MVVELDTRAYQDILPLFADLNYHLSILAVLRGTMLGRVLADDDHFPGTVLVSSPEENYLACAGPSGTRPAAPYQPGILTPCAVGEE